MEDALDQSKSGLAWRLLFLALAIVIHAATLRAPIQWPKFSVTAPKIEVVPIDPARLQALKDSIQKNKSLLLSPDSKAKDQEKPDRARYFSDRNNRIENETKAPIRDALPKKGAQKDSSSKRPMPLARFGIPWSEKRKSAQSLDDSVAREASENLLNTERSTYYSFYSRVYEAIAPIWESKIRSSQPGRVLNGDYRTLVDVVLDQEGTLLDIRLMQSSGIAAFDDAADDAWKSVRGFPNPPRGLLSSDGKIHIGYSFTVQVSRESGIQFLAPERAGS